MPIISLLGRVVCVSSWNLTTDFNFRMSHCSLLFFVKLLLNFFPGFFKGTNSSTKKRDEPLLLLLGHIFFTKWFKHEAILMYAGTGTVVPNSIKISILDFSPFTLKKSIAVMLAILW